MALSSELTEKASIESGISRGRLIRTKVAETLSKVPDPIVIAAAAFLAQTDESKSIFIAAGLIGMVILEDLI